MFEAENMRFTANVTAETKDSVDSWVGSQILSVLVRVVLLAGKLVAGGHGYRRDRGRTNREMRERERSGREKGRKEVRAIMGILHLNKVQLS